MNNKTLKEHLKQIIKSVILETRFWDDPTEQDFEGLERILKLSKEQMDDLRNNKNIHNLAMLINKALQMKDPSIDLTNPVIDKTRAEIKAKLEKPLSN